MVLLCTKQWQDFAITVVDATNNLHIMYQKTPIQTAATVTFTGVVSNYYTFQGIDSTEYNKATIR